MTDQPPVEQPRQELSPLQAAQQLKNRAFNNYATAAGNAFGATIMGTVTREFAGTVANALTEFLIGGPGGGGPSLLPVGAWIAAATLVAMPASTIGYAIGAIRSGINGAHFDILANRAEAEAITGRE